MLARSTRVATAKSSAQLTGLVFAATSAAIPAWLHDLCGNVQNWHGLPDNWRQLTGITPLDMIPWQWTLKPSNNSYIVNTTSLGYVKATKTCASNEWKLGSFALVNIATFFTAFLGQRTGTNRIARVPCFWVFKGTLIAALQLLASWFNVFLVQKTPGYEDVPAHQLMLLWCSMPRLAWLTILLNGVQPFEVKNFSTAASLFAEMILQVLTSYYMVMTVNYGREHDFYLGGLEGAERGRLAKIMYAGALMWLIIISLTFVQLMWAIQPTSNIAEGLMDNSRGLEETPLTRSKRGNSKAYGTFPIKGQNNWISQKKPVKLYAAAVIRMLPLWIAQWLFWGGFIALSSEEFCPPKLGVLTTVWIAFSLAGVTVGAI
ncbi:hypothetical protein B7463_g9466, partial [Scytalidium lignicola]